MRIALLRTVAVALLLAAPSPSASAFPFFSLDIASPTLPCCGYSESDVFAPGAIGGPPPLVVPAGGLGLIGFGVDELNAMTTGSPPSGLIFFSVDRATAGVASVPATVDVSVEAAVGQAAGDIFVSPGRSGPNILATNQDLMGLVPALPFKTPVPPPIDDLDALDTIGAPPMLMALALGHPYLGASGFGGCGGDLFIPVAGGPPAPALPFFALGLATCLDDVDALHFDPGTSDLYFSLAPGSPSLAPGVICAAGCSPADILVAPGGGGVAFFFAPAAALGLLFTDNVNAIDMPEPAVVSQLAAGVLLLWGLRGRSAPRA
jgi:hypothetical protein